MDINLLRYDRVCAGLPEDDVDGSAGDVAKGVAKVAVGAVKGATLAAAGVDPEALLLMHYKVLQSDNISLRATVCSLTDTIARLNQSVDDKNKQIASLMMQLATHKQKRK